MGVHTSTVRFNSQPLRADVNKINFFLKIMSEPTVAENIFLRLFTHFNFPVIFKCKPFPLLIEKKLTKRMSFVYIDIL